MIYLYSAAAASLFLLVLAIVYISTNNARKNNSLPVKMVDKNELVSIWIVCDKYSRFWIKIIFDSGEASRFVGSYKTFNEAWDMASRIDIRGLTTSK